MNKQFFGPNSKIKSKFIDDLRAINRTKYKKDTTNLHNKMYSFFYEKNRLDLLSVYLLLFQRYPTKRFYINNLDKRWYMDKLAKDFGMGRSTLEKKIKDLIEIGVMSSGLIDKNNYNNQKYVYSLASNKELDEKFGKCKKNPLFLNLYKYSTYGSVKKFLITIPILSNLNRQSRKVDTYQESQNIEKGNPNFRRNRHVALKKQKLKDRKRCSISAKKISQGTAMNLSHNGICRVVNKKSPTTAAKYKKFLRENLEIYEYKRTKIICNVESREHFYYLKDEGKIPNHALLSNDNKAFVKLSNIIFPSYNPDFIKARDVYYEKHLMAYVESRITDRNITRDNITIAKHLYDKMEGKDMVVDVKDLYDYDYDVNHIDIHNKIVNHMLAGGDMDKIRIFATNPKRISHDNFIYDMKVSVPEPAQKRNFIKVIDSKGILGKDGSIENMKELSSESPNIALANTTF
jgi:hypothetical protein